MELHWVSTGIALSLLHFPQVGILLHETDGVNPKKSEIAELRRFVPVLRGGAPLIALIQLGKDAGNRVEPGDRDISRLADLKCHPPQLEQIRGWSECEIQIKAPFQAGRSLTVERPDTFRCSRYLKIERAVPHPTVDNTLLRQPLTITVDLIGETCRTIFVLKNSRATQQPAIALPVKTTGIVTDGVQATPKNRPSPHTWFSNSPELPNTMMKGLFRL